MEATSLEQTINAGLAELRRTLPGWHCWTVITLTLGVRWCGRPKGYPHGVADAGSPSELAEAARAWEAEHRG